MHRSVRVQGLLELLYARYLRLDLFREALCVCHKDSEKNSRHRREAGSISSESDIGQAKDDDAPGTHLFPFVAARVPICIKRIRVCHVGRFDVNAHHRGISLGTLVVHRMCMGTPFPTLN